MQKITHIEELGELDSIDIEVDGNHLFFANGILTHNSNTDVEITDTSESFGLPATVDLMFALISTEELEKLGQLMVKQLKNRYNDIIKNKRFVIGVDRSKMKLFDVENKAQNLMKEPARPGAMGSASFGSTHVAKRGFDDFVVE